jgi:DNA polymerase-4
MMDLGALGLCRDFLRGRSRDSARCAHCGSPRTVNLKAAAGLEIAHVDCDAFYASVEKRDDAGLRDERWLSAGRAACSRYDLLLHRSHLRGPIGDADVASSRAMPQRRRIAARHGELCTDWPRNSRQDAGAHAPREPPVDRREFLDLTGCERSKEASAAETLTGFARRVEGEIGVTVLVGFSYCKFLAKLASDLDKPRAFALVPRHEAKTWLAPQSVGRLWGVGRTGRERLERLGFRLIGDLQGIDEREAVSGVV